VPPNGLSSTRTATHSIPCCFASFVKMSNLRKKSSSELGVGGKGMLAAYEKAPGLPRASRFLVRAKPPTRFVHQRVIHLANIIRPVRYGIRYVLEALSSRRVMIAKTVMSQPQRG
jgi:hypothetical protein